MKPALHRPECCVSHLGNLANPVLLIQGEGYVVQKHGVRVTELPFASHHRQLQHVRMAQDTSPEFTSQPLLSALLYSVSVPPWLCFSMARGARTSSPRRLSTRDGEGDEDGDADQAERSMFSSPVLVTHGERRIHPCSLSSVLKSTLAFPFAIFGS